MSSLGGTDVLLADKELILKNSMLDTGSPRKVIFPQFPAVSRGLKSLTLLVLASDP